MPSASQPSQTRVDEETLRIVAAVKGAREVKIQSNIMMVPEGCSGPFKANVPSSRGPGGHEEILFTDFDFSNGAIELFDMALRYSKVGMLPTSYADPDGRTKTINIDAPDGLKAHVIDGAIRSCVKLIGEGWEQDGDGFRKLLPAYATKGDELRGQEQRGVMEAILSGNVPNHPKMIKPLMLDPATNEPISLTAGEERRDYIFAIWISKADAARINSALGTSIGRSR